MQRLKIDSLAHALQRVELVAGGSASDPWFDGAPFGNTLIAAPKSGSKLRASGAAAATDTLEIRRWAGRAVFGLALD